MTDMEHYDEAKRRLKEEILGQVDYSRDSSDEEI